MILKIFTEIFSILSTSKYKLTNCKVLKTYTIKQGRLYLRVKTEDQKQISDKII